MKCIIYFILILTIPFMGYSQDKSKYDIGFESVFTTKSVFAYLNGGIKINKTKINVGVTYGNAYVNHKNILGAQVDFIYSPNENLENIKYKLHFITSLNYFKNKVSLNESSVETNTLQLTFGYGFSYPFSKKTSLVSNLGVGSILEIRKYSFSTNSPKFKLGFAGMASLGLKYSL